MATTQTVGGGVSNSPFLEESGTTTLVNCTVTGNIAANGGGISNGGGAPGGLYGGHGRGTVIVANSIVAGNSASAAAPDIFGPVSSKGHNLIGNTDGSSGWVASDLTGTDPMLGPLADNGGPTQTMALQASSPAIDAGNNDLALDVDGQPLTTDQRGVGFPRIVNNIVDIGAFEVPSLIVTTLNDVVDPTDGQTSLREAIAACADTLSSDPHHYLRRWVNRNHCADSAPCRSQPE